VERQILAPSDTEDAKNNNEKITGMIFIIDRYIIKKNIISLIKYVNYLLFSLQYICALALSMGSEQSQPDSKLQQLHRLETKYSRMNKGTNKAMGIRDKIMFLRGFLGERSQGRRKKYIRSASRKKRNIKK
jgi:hypothetical protein